MYYAKITKMKKPIRRRQNSCVTRISRGIFYHKPSRYFIIIYKNNDKRPRKRVYLSVFNMRKAEQDRSRAALFLFHKYIQYFRNILFFVFDPETVQLFVTVFAFRVRRISYIFAFHPFTQFVTSEYHTSNQLFFEYILFFGII